MSIKGRFKKNQNKFDFLFLTSIMHIKLVELEPVVFLNCIVNFQWVHLGVLEIAAHPILENVWISLALILQDFTVQYLPPLIILLLVKKKLPKKNCTRKSRSFKIQ